VSLILVFSFFNARLGKIIIVISGGGRTAIIKIIKEAGAEREGALLSGALLKNFIAS